MKILDRVMVHKLDDFIDRTLNKVGGVNKPYRAIKRTEQYKNVQAMFGDGIREQGRWASDNLSKLMDSAGIQDDLQPLGLEQEQKLKGLVKRDMPALSELVSQVKVFNNLVGFFEWSVRQQYKRWGYTVKADLPEFTKAQGFSLTNTEYINALKDRAAYLLNQSALDSTTSDSIISIVSDGKLAGMTNDEVAMLLKDQFDEISDSRAEMIARTESANAIGDANHASAVENGAKTHSWIVAGPGCDQCDPNEDDGEIPIDQEFSSGDLSEPAHPNCILGGQDIEGWDIYGKIVSDYNGPAVELISASGKRLSVTPNHKVATPNGWVAASQLNKSDNVISAPFGIERMATAINPNSKPTKALIDDVVISGDVVFNKMPATAVDFDGDEIACKNINVVLADSRLRDNLNAFRMERHAELKLSLRNIGLKLLATFSSFNKLSLATLHANNGVLSLFRQDSSQLRPGLVHQSTGSAMAADSDAGLLKMIGERQSTDSDLWGKFLDRFASHVTLDKIVKIRNYNFSGHVYDLSTQLKFYTTNTIITHNCECYTEAGEIDLDSIDLWGGE